MERRILARKYRPESFDQVVGQAHVIRVLINAIRLGRIAEAYLLTGPRGVGKTSLARIFAKCLNCLSGPTAMPCGACRECIGIRDGCSGDVREIDGASNNGIEQVKGIRESVRLGPSSGKYRIYIIDEVHMLSSSAFNALQKTVEEPPQHAKFIFATTEAGRLPLSFRSRCQSLDLKPLDEKQISGHLSKIASSEGIVLDQEAGAAIARAARGGMRDAESMLDQAIAAGGNHVTEVGVGEAFGMASMEDVCGTIRDIIETRLGNALSRIISLSENGKDLAGFAAELGETLVEYLVTESGGGRASPWRERHLSSLRGRVPVDRLGQMVEVMGGEINSMSFSNDKKVSLETAVLKGFQSLHTASTDEVLDVLVRLSGGVAD